MAEVQKIFAAFETGLWYPYNSIYFSSVVFCKSLSWDSMNLVTSPLPVPEPLLPRARPSSPGMVRPEVPRPMEELLTVHFWKGICKNEFFISYDIRGKIYFRSGLKKIEDIALPWWRSGWESACQCRRHGFEPWSGKIPHAMEQLGPWATATEPARLEPVLRNKRGRDSERPAHRHEEWPLLAATGESPRTETKTQHSYK